MVSVDLLAGLDANLEAILWQWQRARGVRREDTRRAVASERARESTIPRVREESKHHARSMHILVGLVEVDDGLVRGRIDGLAMTMANGRYQRASEVSRYLAHAT